MTPAEQHAATIRAMFDAGASDADMAAALGRSVKGIESARAAMGLWRRAPRKARAAAVKDKPQVREVENCTIRCCSAQFVRDGARILSGSAT